MKPAIEELPDLVKLNYGFGIGEIGFRRFAVARVAPRGKEPVFFATSRHTNELSMAALAAELALSVGKAACFRGAKFHYTRPDPAQAPPVGDQHSAATTPVVATTLDGAMTITLWWALVMFGKPYGSSHDMPQVIARGTRFEHWPTHNTRTPTDCFLEALTGIPRPVRRGIYVPVESSSPWVRKHEAYYPRIISEGATDGEEAGWTCGVDRMLAVRRSFLQNRQAGLSNLDIADIVGRYRSNEPDPNEEPEAEIYWMSED